MQKLKRIPKVLAAFLLACSLPVFAYGKEAGTYGICLDTGDIFVTATGHMPEGAYLSVRQVDEDEIGGIITDRTCEDGGEFIVYAAYDIKIMTDEGEYEPDDGDIVLYLENIRTFRDGAGGDATVIHIDGDENIEELPSVITGDDVINVEFMTPGFSIFAIGEYIYSSEEDNYYSERIVYPDIGSPTAESVKATLTRGYTMGPDGFGYHDGYMLMAEGNGDMADFALPPWEDLKESITQTVMVSGVTKVGARSFYECENLAYADMYDSVTAIGDEAFYGCCALSEVYMSYKLEEIGERAFYGCTALESFNFLDGLRKIGDDAFYGCENLETLNFYGTTLTTSHELPYTYYKPDGEKLRVIEAGKTYNGTYTKTKPYPDFIVSVPASIGDIASPGDITVDILPCDTALSESFWVSVSPKDAVVTMLSDDTDDTATLTVSLDNKTGSDRVYGIRNTEVVAVYEQTMTFSAASAGIYTGTVTYEITSGLDP